MTNAEIQEFIGRFPLQPIKKIMHETEDFIKGFKTLPRALQEVGAVRRGEPETHAIELLIVSTYPSLQARGGLVGTLKHQCDDLDMSRDDVWTMTYYGIPVVIWICSKEVFIEHQLIRTGPPVFVEIVAEAATARGFTLDERGFRKGRTLLMPFSEADIFTLVGLPYVPPQERARFASERKEI